MPKRMYKKRNNWCIESERLLIQLWKNNYEIIQKTRKRIPIYDEMANELRKANFSVTAEEIKTKLHNLQSKYKNEKVLYLNDQTSSWPHYEAIRALMSKKGNRYVAESFDSFEEAVVGEPKSEDEEFYDESMTELPLHSASYSATEESNGAPFDTTRTLTPPPIPATKKMKTLPQTAPRLMISHSRSISEQSHSILDKILSSLDNLESSNKTLNEHSEKVTQELMDLEKRKVDLLEKYVTNTCKVQSAFMDYINRQK